ncbi:MAG: glycosyltransferase family 87 protein [Actinomycetota bacterium]
MDTARETELGKRPVLLPILVLVSIVAIAAIVLQMLPAQLDGSAGADLAEDYASARDLHEGRDPFAPGLPDSMRRHIGPRPNGNFPEQLANPHPPALVAVQVPVAKLPWDIVRVGWLLASIGAIALSCFVVAVRFGFDPLTAISVALIVLALPMTEDALFNGTIEPLLLPLFVGAWFALGQGRERRAGLFLGLAIALKLYPIFFALALVRRHRKALFWSLAGATVFFLAGSLITLTSPLHALAVSRHNIEIWGTATLNVGLPAFFIQLFDGLNKALPSWASVVYVAMLGAGVMWVVGGRRDLWGAAPALVFAPICWNSYFLFAVPALIRQVRTRVPAALLIATTIALGISWRLPIYDATINTLGPLLLMIGEARSQDAAPALLSPGAAGTLRSH